jgi:hypothetical protein
MRARPRARVAGVLDRGAQSRDLDIVGAQRLQAVHITALNAATHARPPRRLHPKPSRRLSQKSKLSSPTVKGSGSAGTRRTARSTPGMKDSRLIESWRMLSV